MKNIIAILLLAFTASTAFSQNLTFKMSVASEKSKKTITMNVVVLGEKVAVQPNIDGVSGKMTMIMDEKSGKMIMLMNTEGKKMGMIMNRDDVKATHGDKSKAPKITTTTVKQIKGGYQCTKVIAESDDTQTEIWVTNDLGISYSSVFKMMQKGNQGSPALPALNELKGFPVEMHIHDKLKNENLTMTISEVKKGNASAAIFNTAGYEMMDLSGQPKP